MPRWLALCSFFVGTGSVFLIMLRWFSRRPVLCTCDSHVPRHAVITGATSGIGRATAIELARRNWRVTLGCRNLTAANSLIEEIALQTGNRKVEAKHLDLIEPKSVLQFANSFSRDEVDVLINNAAVMASTPRPVAAFGGLNVDTVTNYLGPFYLTHLMIPKLKELEERSHYPRVIFVSSSLAKKGNVNNLFDAHTSQTQWNTSEAYANSKLALCLYARELYRRFGCGDNTRLNVYCLFTGGMVHTNLGSEILSNYPTLIRSLLGIVSRWMLKSPTEGCQSVVHCAVSDSIATAHSTAPFKSTTDPSGSGLLYSNCVPIPWPDVIPDSKQEYMLWEQSMRLLNLKDM